MRFIVHWLQVRVLSEKPGNRIEKFFGFSVDVDQGTFKYSYL